MRILGLVISSLLIAGPAMPQAPTPGPLTLRAGDVVQVRLLREPTLSGDFSVDDRGFVALPILGPRAVTLAPWAVVRDSILAAYARELSDPSVAVLALHRISVLGSVSVPGWYLAAPSLTLAEAVALAGGATADGDHRRIRVVRDGATLIESVSVDAPLAQAGIRSGDQIFVERRGWFDRNSATAVSAFVGLLGVILTVAILR